ncbi:MFS transporter [Kitasatospora sp. NPDC059146]|uniref:MFS transporter n=1 Tax=unclassified Kitasatospora TaxID=2633591 RepID=UPI003686FCE9
MSTTLHPTPPATAPAPERGWPAVVAVTTGIFAIVTTEILPVGLLTPIGATFRISDGTAGLMMTLPGAVAAVAAPAVTVAVRRADRRAVLCGLMLALALAGLLTALAPGYWAVLTARVVLGVVIGAFWSLGAGLAPRLVGVRRQGRANSVIFSAVPLGSVLGVPAGVLLGHLAGWRAAFAAMALLSLAVAAALAVTLPPLPPQTPTRPAVLCGLLRTGPVLAGLAVTLLLVTAHFGTYTYVTPFLEDVTHAGPGAVSALLLVYGVAGVAGNFAGGLRAGRSRAALTLATGLLAAAVLLLPAFGRSLTGAVPLLVVWGLAYGAVPVCVQSWFVRAAPQAPEAATVVFTSSFQATISLGALAGGAVVDAWSPSAVMVVGGCLALAAAVVAQLAPRSVATA